MLCGVKCKHEQQDPHLLPNARSQVIYTQEETRGFISRGIDQPQRQDTAISRPYSDKTAFPTQWKGPSVDKLHPHTMTLQSYFLLPHIPPKLRAK